MGCGDAGGAEAPRLPGLEEACRALAEGRAVVVPNPSPQTYGVVATTPEAVNLLKRRPSAQPVAVSVHREWDRIAPTLDVPPDSIHRIRGLLTARLSVLAPRRPTAPHPGWLSPALRDGYLGMFDGRWSPLAPLWDRFGRLYGSSANRTGGRPASSAGEAAAMFGDEAVIVDGDALRDHARPHQPSTMIRISPNGTLTLHRRGAQGAASELDPEVDLS